MSFSLEDIANSLKEASTEYVQSGVSFAGKSLKLDSEKDGELYYSSFL